MLLFLLYFDQINAVMSIRDFFQSDLKIFPTLNFWTVAYISSSAAHLLRFQWFFRFKENQIIIICSAAVCGRMRAIDLMFQVERVSHPRFFNVEIKVVVALPHGD